MKRKLQYATLLGACLVAGRASGQTPTVTLAVPGPADWNLDSTWTSEIGPVIPGDGFPAEVAGITNGGTAFLAAPASFPIDGLVLSNGTLDLRNAGSLTVVANGGEAFGATNIGGAGTLSMGGNGRLKTDTFNQSGTIAKRVSGAANGVVEATLSANLAGPLSMTFNNFTPTVGQSWQIIDAPGGQLTGSFTTVTPTGLAKGLIVTPTYDRANGDASVTVDNRLVMTVDYRTGAATFGNLIGPGITLDGYSVSSPSGQLSPTGWQSLDDQNTPAGFFEANPQTDRVSELNPSGAHTLAAGQSLSIGSPYNWQPAAFGEAEVEDLEFTYFTPDGEVEQGIVEYTGLRNNLVLTVDPDSGEAAIQNQSTFGISLDFYTITSASGSLNPAGWNSLDDQGVGSWAEANPTDTRLSELFPVGGSAFSPGQGYEIGDAFVAGGTQDLAIRFTFADGTEFDGIVQYGDVSLPPVGQPGDTNGDGSVNLDDLNAVRNNFGAAGQPGSTPGDAFPFDGEVDLDDLNAVRNNFGAGGSAAVPEPATFGLALLGLPFLVRRLRRR
jgi:hypothetical protein